MPVLMMVEIPGSKGDISARLANPRQHVPFLVDPEAPSRRRLGWPFAVTRRLAVATEWRCWWRCWRLYSGKRSSGVGGPRSYRPVRATPSRSVRTHMRTQGRTLAAPAPRVCVKASSGARRRTVCPEREQQPATSFADRGRLLRASRSPAADARTSMLWSASQVADLQPLARRPAVVGGPPGGWTVCGPVQLLRPGYRPDA